VSMSDSIRTLSVFCILPWLFLAWFRIPRYTRCFQIENYDYVRYFLWLYHTKAEYRYYQAFVAAVLIAPCAFCAAFFFLPSTILSAIVDYPLLAGFPYYAIFLAALIFAPRSKPGREPFQRTARAIRLLVTASFIELVLVLLGIAMIFNDRIAIADPLNSPEAMGILALPYLGSILLVIILIGPVVYVLTPITLLLANLLNRPSDILRGWSKPEQ